MDKVGIESYLKEHDYIFPIESCYENKDTHIILLTLATIGIHNVEITPEGDALYLSLPEDRVKALEVILHLSPLFLIHGNDATIEEEGMIIKIEQQKKE